MTETAGLPADKKNSMVITYSEGWSSSAKVNADGNEQMKIMLSNRRNKSYISLTQSIASIRSIRFKSLRSPAVVNSPTLNELEGHEHDEETEYS